MKNKKGIYVLLAIFAAVLYAINTPFSKLLLDHVPTTIMAGLLYLGAGLGIGAFFLADMRRNGRHDLLTKEDMPYTVGMVALDILAPILLMWGLKNTGAANAALLNNFEIVATGVIAFTLFKEVISKLLWTALLLVTLSSVILSFEDISGFSFSWGSILVLIAALCWGLENNCTRSISMKNTFEIVAIKGICSGTGALIIGKIIGQEFPPVKYVFFVLLLGFTAYGLGLICYIRAQGVLGAAKTSAYYAIGPFVGAGMSFIIFKESLSFQFLLGLAIMIIGTAIATYDTLKLEHEHYHTHTISHTRHGKTYTREIVHSHKHSHLHEHEHEEEKINHRHIHPLLTRHNTN